MLKTIITREFFNNILNLRFIVGLVLCVIITVSCVVILTNDYKKENNDYNLRLHLQDEFLDKYAHTNRINGMINPQKPPERFRPLIIGIPKDADIGSFDDNPLPILFPPLDFLFIVTILMSLLAILFSYDSITGERQAGTLRLVISNSVSRAKLLVAKWIGGTSSLLIPFIFSLLAGAIYISINPIVHWDTLAWIEFYLLIVASVTFISLFYLLGLMVSTFSRYSSTSILNSLLLWVLLILIIPNMCPFIAAQLYRIPSVNKIQSQIYYLTQIERDELGRQLSKEVRKQFEDKYGKVFSDFYSISNNSAEVQKRAAIDQEFKLMVEDYRKQNDQVWNKANQIQKSKADKLEKDLNTKIIIQNRIAKNLACISPFANFVYLATDLTGTGLRSIGHFERVAEEYESKFGAYFWEKAQAAREKDPTFNENSLLDISDRPHFVFKEESLKGKLNTVLPYWGILFLFNIMFWWIAFVRFTRYDVR